MEPLLEFTLLATLPRQLLSLCASALPRPFWEPYLHVIVALVMSFAFVIVIFLAYFDAQKYVLQCTFTFSRNKSGSDLYPMGTVFDLNAVVGANARFDDRRSVDYKAGKCFATSEHQSSFTLKNKLIDSSQVTRSRSSSSSSSDGSSKSNVPRANGINCAAKSSRDRAETSEAVSSSKKKKATPRHETIREKQRQTQGDVESSNREPKQRRRSQPQDYEDVTPLPVGKPRIVYEDTLDAVQQDEEKRTKAKKRPKISNSKKESNKQGVAKEPAQDGQELVGNGYHPPSRRAALQMTTPFYRSSYDKLDEISMTGPKPDVAQYNHTNRMKQQATGDGGKRKLNAYGGGHSDLTRALVDPPTRPPAASLYAVVQKSLSNKQQRKADGNRRKADVDGSCPSSPASSSSGIGNGRVGGDSPSKQDSQRGNRSGSSSRSTNEAWPFVKGHLAVPSSSASSSPRLPKEQGSRSKDVFVWPNSSTPGGGSKQQNGPAPTGSDSMFFYDNLSSLRASKERVPLDRAPGSKIRYSAMPDERPATLKSKLSADSAEFVPSVSRLAPIGSRQSTVGAAVTSPTSVVPTSGVSSLWGDSGSTELKDSPRLSHDTSGWSFGGFMGGGSRHRDSSTLLPSFGQDTHLASLLPSNISDDDNDEAFGQSSFRDGPTIGEESDIWGRDTDDTTDTSSDFGWSSRTPGLQRSIWSADVPASSTQNVPRSLIGLDLSLPLRPTPSPVEQSSVDHSPLDPFGSIWSSPSDNLDVPYDGWMNDIPKNTGSH